LRGGWRLGAVGVAGDELGPEGLREIIFQHDVPVDDG
jgi:hypothetical protein